MLLNIEQFENYSRLVTAFNNKLNTEAPGKLLPIMSAYAAAMKSAGSGHDDRERAVTVFSGGVHAILSDCLKDYLTIQSESFYLKLTAAEKLADILSRLENQFDASFRYTRQLLKDYISEYPMENLVAAYTEQIRIYERETGLILVELAEQIGRAHV